MQLPISTLTIVQRIFNSHSSNAVKDYNIQQLIQRETDPEIQLAISESWSSLNMPVPNKAQTKSGWTHDTLQLDKKGNIMVNPSNLFTILTQHEKFKGCLTFNELSHAVCYKGEPIQDKDFTRLRTDLCNELRMTFSKADVIDMAELIAYTNKFHPIRNYFASLTWDNQDHVADFLTAMRIENSPLNREVMGKWFIACVARVLHPGCKVDSIPVFQGLTGNRKSTAIRALCHDPEWFCDEHIDFDTKDSMQMLLGKWIVELAELSSFQRKENNQIKANITRTVDEFRAPYDRKTKKYPRQFVYVGTTNDSVFLSDPTSNRRYWVFVNEGIIDTDALVSMRDQLWAQAIMSYKNNEQHWLSREMEEQMALRASEFEEKDVWHNQVVQYLSDKDFVTTEDVLGSIGKSLSHSDHSDKNRVYKILQGLKWTTTSRRINGDSKSGWKRPDADKLPKPIQTWAN